VSIDEQGSADDLWDLTPQHLEPDPAGTGDDPDALDDEHNQVDPADAPPEPRYPDLEAWVTQWLAPTVRREVNARKPGGILAWCPQWWRHAEAITRLEGLWRCWELARVAGAEGRPDAFVTWWLTMADPTLAVLFDPEQGPFARCHRAGHEDLPALPSDPVPPGWWNGRHDRHDADSEGNPTA
jgi:hypothetical protein